LSEDIRVNHFTKIKAWRPLIREIYSLLPNVSVKFISNKGPFIWRRKEAARGNPFPEFEFPKSSHPLPEKYTVLAPQSGKPLRYERGRTMRQEEVDKALKASPYPVVVLGISQARESVQKEINYHKALNLIDKTGLLEASGIVQGAESFVGFQGYLAYVALSQRVPSIIYVNGQKEWEAFTIRIFKKWLPYCLEIRMRCGDKARMPKLAKLHGA
jgi:hypothetical protein